jgi:undecaprenyl-phosphate 4-deoxy-4-formamido-L-arabinose transferase
MPQVSTLPTVSVVVPVSDGAAALPGLVARLGDELPALARRFEVILVNDGSHDRSWDVIQTLAAERPWLRGLNLMRRYGQPNALLCGIRAAVYDFIVTLDDGRQSAPEEIGRLLARLAEGPDVVYGALCPERRSLWRTLAAGMTQLALQGAMGAVTARQVSPFRAFRAQLRGAFEQYQGPCPSIDVLLTWGTTRFAAVPVSGAGRSAGRSGGALREWVKPALELLAFTNWPLRAASLAGFALIGLGLAYGVGRYLLTGIRWPGLPDVAAALAIVSGIQVLALGIIGEHLARRRFPPLGPPAYTVRACTPEPELEQPWPRLRTGSESGLETRST